VLMFLGRELLCMCSGMWFLMSSISGIVGMSWCMCDSVMFENDIICIGEGNCGCVVF